MPKSRQDARESYAKQKVEGESRKIIQAILRASDSQIASGHEARAGGILNHSYTKVCGEIEKADSDRSGIPSDRCI